MALRVYRPLAMPFVNDHVAYISIPVSAEQQKDANSRAGLILDLPEIATFLKIVKLRASHHKSGRGIKTYYNSFYSLNF